MNNCSIIIYLLLLIVITILLFIALQYQKQTSPSVQLSSALSPSGERRTLSTTCNNGNSPQYLSSYGPGICYDVSNDSGVKNYQYMVQYAPLLDNIWLNDLELYLPLMSGCGFIGRTGCQSTDTNTGSLYFSWVSHTYNQPIVSGYMSSGQQIGQGSQRCSTFGTCCINGITQGDYTDARSTDPNTYCMSSTACFDRGHQVPDDQISIEYGSPNQTYNMCNIGPQTSALNRGKWEHLEMVMVCIGNNTSNQIVFDGPMTDSSGNFASAFTSKTGKF